MAKKVTTEKPEKKQLYEYCNVMSDSKESFDETVELREKFKWVKCSEVGFDEKLKLYTVNMKREVCGVEVEEKENTENDEH